ncbi:MAG: alpha-ketoacid dehydrogenase subunit beta [Planctomycetaceae bacterium]|nr:alpha-ketoacid dehydrogenase subunit beta [Planctomycetaceae bacterium]
MSKQLSISKAVREGLHEEMVRDATVVVMGEDMADMGSVFGITQGFLDEFGPLRVIDTPISESGFSGMAVGMAMRGLRPVVEWMYDDFITCCLDPVMNQAAKLRYMTGGQLTLPIVFRAPMGAGRRNAGQHSQCLEALFTHIPGLKVVCPSTAADHKGLLKSAIRDNDPVIFLEHKLLYAKKEEVPEDDDYLIPLGKADVKRPGRDLTIITWSRQVYFALEAAEALAADGIDAEVLDLRSLVPLDWDAVRESVVKTHNVMIVEEGVKRGGVGAELAAEIMEDLFDELDSPVARVAGANVVSPFSPPLEDAVFPHPADIIAAAKKLLRGE